MFSLPEQEGMTRRESGLWTPGRNLREYMTRSTILRSGIFGGGVGGPPPPSTLYNQLESFWKLDDVNDAIGTNHLTNVNSAGFVGGKIGNCVDLERDTTQYLSKASNASLQTGNVSFAFVCWIKPESLANYTHPLAKWGAGNEYILEMDAAGILGWYVAGSYKNWGSALKVGTWYHAYVEHNADTDTIGIKIDDGVMLTAALVGGPTARASAFTLGSYGAGTGPWDGLIDAVGFWKGRVLTAAECTETYNSGNGWEPS